MRRVVFLADMQTAPGPVFVVGYEGRLGSTQHESNERERSFLDHGYFLALATVSPLASPVGSVSGFELIAFD